MSWPGRAVIALFLTSACAAAGEPDEQTAIRFIEEVGGQFKRDEAAPGKPVTEVDLVRTDVDDESLKQLATLRHLRVLSLYGRKVTGVGLKELAGLKELRSLDLSVSEVTDAGLKEVSRLG